MGLIPTLCSLVEYQLLGPQTPENIRQSTQALQATAVLGRSRSLPSLRLAPSSLGFPLGLTGVLSAAFRGPLWRTPTPSPCCTVLCIRKLRRLFLSFLHVASVKSKAKATCPTCCCLDSLECSACMSECVLLRRVPWQHKVM